MSDVDVYIFCKRLENVTKDLQTNVHNMKEP